MINPKRLLRSGLARGGLVVLAVATGLAHCASVQARPAPASRPGKVGKSLGSPAAARTLARARALPRQGRQAQPLPLDPSILLTPSPPRPAIPLMQARALREAGAHAPPVAPPLQLEAAPRTELLTASAALRLRSLFAQRPPSSPMEGPEAPAQPIRVAAMLPRMPLPLPAPAPKPVMPPQAAAPGPWGEPHMEREELALGRWARPSLPPAYYKVHFAPHAPQTCVPAKLKKVLYDIAEKVGEVRVVSTFRDPARNRRVGGASRSMHLECRAIDFFVPGAHRDLVAYLRSRPEVGGYKRYPWGFYHIDNGPRRTW